MHISYKKFPELRHLDDDKKYEAMKFCVGKSRWFSLLFLPCLFAFSYFVIELSDEMVLPHLQNASSMAKLFAALVPVFILNLTFILLCVSTIVHKLVKTHINEYGKT